MFFSKYPHPSNFSFVDDYDETKSTVRIGSREFGVSVTRYEGGLTHIQLQSPETWGGSRCIEPLELPPEKNHSHLKIGKGFKIQVQGLRGKSLLKGSLGVSDAASMFVFELGADAKFFGMGEKSFGKFELSGYRTKFWNTDVWSDFHFAQWAEHPTDPPYFSMPYLVARVGEEYVGLLLHNPSPTFMETPGIDEARVFVEWQRTSPNLILGAEGGEPNLWIIYGPTLKELTRKLQKLVGVTPLPPIWALGYHQSRWGYGGHDDLLKLDRQFEEHQIPCDSLWLDLDYMNGFRIFETSKKMFPKGASVTAKTLAKNRRRIVPILDPGVKFEAGYRVYDDGHNQDVFCKNPEGKEFVGLVWPGETVFPDFTQPKAREWWTGYVEEFAQSGFAASWLDMNDPSTGPVDPTSMLFAGGSDSHVAHRNQYALGMQRATQEGFIRARPEERPFLLSRSGFVGSSRYAAIWSGDNLSNYFYLKLSIPTALGMSISGVPFNGPDVGGFGESVSDALMVDWVKANFLFPFFRNHCEKGSREQEPFAFPDAVMSLVRRYIRLRYKLIPYLYNLFIQQEESGDPILRPLLYEFDTPSLDRIDDQFMVGASILQAPFVEEKAKTRTVVLPGELPWYDAGSGDWIAAGETTAKSDRAGTPMFVKMGSIIPMQAGTPTDNRKELSKVNLHLFIPSDWSGETDFVYHADDGISFEYRQGKRSTISVRIAGVNGNIAIGVRQDESGFGAIEPTFVIHGEARSVRLNGAAAKLNPAKVVLSGKPLKVNVVII